MVNVLHTCFSLSVGERVRNCSVGISTTSTVTPAHEKNARLVLQIHIRISLYCVLGWAFNGAHMIADWLEAIPLSSTTRTARPATATARAASCFPRHAATFLYQHFCVRSCERGKIRIQERSDVTHYAPFFTFTESYFECSFRNHARARAYHGIGTGISYANTAK